MGTPQWAHHKAGGGGVGGGRSCRRLGSPQFLWPPLVSHCSARLIRLFINLLLILAEFLLSVATESTPSEHKIVSSLLVGPVSLSEDFRPSWLFCGGFQESHDFEISAAFFYCESRQLCSSSFPIPRWKTEVWFPLKFLHAHLTKSKLHYYSYLLK